MKNFLDNIDKQDIRNIIAVISVLGAFALLYMMLYMPIPESNKDILNIAIGIVFGGLIGGVNGFYFGASKNETDKKDE